MLQPGTKPTPGKLLHSAVPVKPPVQTGFVIPLHMMFDPLQVGGAEKTGK